MPASSATRSLKSSTAGFPLSCTHKKQRKFTKLSVALWAHTAVQATYIKKARRHTGRFSFTGNYVFGCNEYTCWKLVWNALIAKQEIQSRTAFSCFLPGTWYYLVCVRYCLYSSRTINGMTSADVWVVRQQSPTTPRPSSLHADIVRG